MKLRGERINDSRRGRVKGQAGSFRLRSFSLRTLRETGPTFQEFNGAKNWRQSIFPLDAQSE